MTTPGRNDPCPCGSGNLARPASSQKILSRFNAAREPVPTRRLLDQQECARHMLYRCIETARTCTGASVVYDASAKGWKLEPRGGGFQLPALLFGPEDVLLLLTLRGILERLAPGFLRAELKPFEARLKSLLDNERLGAARLVECVKLILAENREPPSGALSRARSFAAAPPVGRAPSPAASKAPPTPAAADRPRAKGRGIPHQRPTEEAWPM